MAEMPCLSFRQPYGGLLLDGLKTLETRWTPILSALAGRTLAVHIAWRDWEGDGWRAELTALGMDRTQIQALLESGERFGRGVVAGLVDVGVTWQCPALLPEQDRLQLEQAALLIGLEEKYLTRLSNPRWLKAPLASRGHKDIWAVQIPAHLLPA